MDANDTPNIPITSQPTATKSILKKTTSLAQKKRKKNDRFNFLQSLYRSKPDRLRAFLLKEVLI